MVIEHGQKAGDTEDLLEQFFQTRSPNDFEPIVKANMKMVYRIIYRIVLNKEEAEDLVQETMVRAYEKIDTYRGQSKFSTWLCQIGLNMALTSKRKKKYVHVDFMDVVLEAPANNTPDRVTESSEELKKIHQAIAGLSAKLRAVITLSVFEEMDITEIASVLKCPQATVYWRLHQARKILNKKLEFRA